MQLSYNKHIIYLFNLQTASTLDNQLIDILADLGKTEDTNLSLASSLTNGKSFYLGVFHVIHFNFCLFASLN